MQEKVAPLVGAWIEMEKCEYTYTWTFVAPLVGAWIEIAKSCWVIFSSSRSLLSWERGLKFSYRIYNTNNSKVAPLVGAWIEIVYLRQNMAWFLSLLSWERGLKLSDDYKNMALQYVAPLVGAWIEIKVLN